MASWTRGVSLVATIAEAQTLTAVRELANLEDEGELVVADVLLVASDAIYDQLQATGVDPSKITNSEVYKRSVAWHFVGMLFQNGDLTVPEGFESKEDAFSWSDPYFAKVRPELSEGDEPRTSGAGIARVGNLNPLSKRVVVHTRVPRIRRG